MSLNRSRRLGGKARRRLTGRPGTAARVLGIAGGALLALSAGAFVWEWLAAYATVEFFSRQPEEPVTAEAQRTRRKAEELMPESARPDVLMGENARADGVMAESARTDGVGAGEGLWPRASVIIPLKGAAAGNRVCLEGMLGQDYPDFEVIVGVEESDRAAIELVQSVQRDYPGRPLKLVAAGNRLGGPRPKVSNQYNAAEHSTGSFLALIDADIVAGKNFLRVLLKPLLNPGTGLTTSLFRAGSGGGIWSRVDGLWTSTAYLPSALFGRRVIGEGFAFGAAIGISREALEAIGGFEAIAHRVGDDYQLGHLTAARGYRVAFVPYVVTEQVEEIRFRQFVNRRVRWSRTIRTYRPAGYAGLVVTNGVPLAAAAALLAPRDRRRWQWLALVLGNRLACAAVNRRFLDRGAPAADLALVPLRDLIAMAVWAMGFTAERPVLRPGVRP